MGRGVAEWSGYESPVEERRRKNASVRIEDVHEYVGRIMRCT